MAFLRKPGSLVLVWIKSLATAVWCSFCSGSRSHCCGRNVVTTCSGQDPPSKFRTWQFLKSSDQLPVLTVSHRSLLTAACTCPTISSALLVAGLPECGSLSTDSRPSLKVCATILFALHSLHLSKSLLNHPNRFHSGMFKLNTKFDADSLPYLLSHFEWDHHTVYRFTQWHLLPPLTSAVKPLFTHAHSSPLSLAAGLHRCCSNHACYINNGWTFSGQVLCSHNSNHFFHKTMIKDFQNNILCAH